MARKRQRRRPAGDTATDHQGHHDGSVNHVVHVNGDRVKVHQISSQDEGLLYTHRIMVSQFQWMISFYYFNQLGKFSHPRWRCALHRNDGVGSNVEY